MNNTVSVWLKTYTAEERDRTPFAWSPFLQPSSSSLVYRLGNLTLLMNTIDSLFPYNVHSLSDITSSATAIELKLYWVPKLANAAIVMEMKLPAPSIIPDINSDLNIRNKYDNGTLDSFMLVAIE